MSEKKHDPLLGVFGEVWVIIVELIKLLLGVVGIGLASNPEGRRAIKAGVRLGYKKTKQLAGFALLALNILLLVEVLVWPGMIVFGIWRHCVAYGHVHSQAYLGNHFGTLLTTDILFTEWIYTVLVPAFVLFLVVKMIQKVVLIALGLTSGVTGFIGGLIGGLKFEDDKVIQGIRDAIGSGNKLMLAVSAMVFRKGQNENWWSTACSLLIIMVPYFSFPVHPLLPMVISALAVCGLWEINTSAGNNQDALGRSVLEAKTYKVMGADGQPTTGHKFELAGFQMWARGFLGVLITGLAILSYLGFTGAFIGIKYREAVATTTQVEMNKLTKSRNREMAAVSAKLQEAIVLKAQYDALIQARQSQATLEIEGSPQRIAQFEHDREIRLQKMDGQIDSLKTKLNKLPTVEDLNAQLATLSSVDTTAVRDSIAALATARVGIIDAVLPGKVEVKYATPNGLPPADVERHIRDGNNALNGVLIGSDNRTNSVQNYLLWIAILIGVVWLGAKQPSPWARLLVFFPLALWLFVTRSGAYHLIQGLGVPGWATVGVLSLLGAALLLGAFGILSKGSGNNATAAHAH